MTELKLSCSGGLVRGNMIPFCTALDWRNACKQYLVLSCSYNVPCGPGCGLIYSASTIMKMHDYGIKVVHGKQTRLEFMQDIQVFFFMAGVRAFFCIIDHVLYLDHNLTSVKTSTMYSNVLFISEN